MRFSTTLASPPRYPSLLKLVNVLPYASIHLLAIGVFFTGFSWIALSVCVALYVIRMFVITAFYHRYFSHRTFRTSRVLQFIAGFIGTTCAQRGPIWWAAHHRDHHRHSDEVCDIHSPHEHGILWSHMGWFNSDSGLTINWDNVPDLAKHKELVILEKLHMVGPLMLAASMFLLGLGLEAYPGLGTDRWQMFFWGFALSTTILYHGTFTINSIAHVIGKRRFATKDDSRNNFFLSIITLGEGWHNNHHYYPGTARQGFYWWEFDPSYYTLWVMSKLRLVWDLRPVPQRVYDAAIVHRAKLEAQSPRSTPTMKAPERDA